MKGKMLHVFKGHLQSGNLNYDMHVHNFTKVKYLQFEPIGKKKYIILIITCSIYNHFYFQINVYPYSINILTNLKVVSRYRYMASKTFNPALFDPLTFLPSSSSTCLFSALSFLFPINKTETSSLPNCMVKKKFQIWWDLNLKYTDID